jgi:colanic acid biosynthesis glycosyl transferase WcaI
MKRPKVLLLSPFFYPDYISTGKYNSVLAQSLVKAGAEVEVVTFHPFYPTWKPVRSEATLDHISIIRGGLWIRYPRAIILRRLVFELWYSLHVLWILWLKGFRSDIVVAVFPPTSFFCLAPVLLPSTARYVGIVHDFQSTLGLSHNNALVYRLLRRIVRAVDRKSFRSCHSLIVLSKAMARIATQEYGVCTDRVVMAYPFITITARPGPRTSLAAVLPSGVQHVVYSGALGKKQNPYALFRFFRAGAKRFPKVQFHIFSDGPIFQDLRKMHMANPVEGLRLHGLVPEAEVEELYYRSTIQVIPQIEGSADACLPSKLPNIVASGCAPLAICEADSELAQIVGQCSGLSASSWQLDTLISQLEALLELTKRQTTEERRSIAEPILSACFNIDRVVDAVLNVRDVERSADVVPATTVGPEP